MAPQPPAVDRPIQIFAGNETRLIELLTLHSPWHVEDVDWEHRKAFQVHRSEA